MKTFLFGLVILSLVLTPVFQAEAQMRKRVLLDVRAPSPDVKGVVEGVIAKQLNKYRDLLVIDDRYEQSFLPFMKYKAHVIVQVEVLQMYAADIHKTRGYLKRFGSGIADVAAWTLAIGTLGMAGSVLDDGAETGGRAPHDFEGHLVANVSLFDMWTERSFARTQTNFTIRVKNAHHDDNKIMLTYIAENGFGDVAKWIWKETRARPGQTWVFADSNEQVFVNAGTLDGVWEGERLKVYKPKPIYAPKSDVVVGHSAKFECEIKIVQVDELFSLAQPIKHALSGEYIAK